MARFRTILRPVLDGEGNQTGFEQVVHLFTPEEEAGADAREAEAAAAALAIPVPQSVSMRQARLALLAANLLDDIEALLATMPRAAQIEWEYATDVRRDSPLIAVVKSEKGMTDAQIDALFVAAGWL